MKRLFKNYNHLASLAAIVLCMIMLAVLGVVHSATAILVIGSYQLLQFAMSKRSAHCFTTALTPEQLKEFQAALGELKSLTDLIPGLKELSTTDGGFSAIKALPAALKTANERYDQVKSDLDKFRKAQAVLKSTRINRSGEVSDDCARYLGMLALGVGVKRGQVTGRAADMAESLFKEVFGAEMKTALTSSDIPLPTEYSGQVVELVGMYGAARKYGTVFPLGSGTVKLPKLSTDPTFVLIAGSGTVTEKSPQAAFVTFTAEKFGGLVRLPTELEDDSIIPIGQFIARYAARNIARAEDTNFFVGTGAGSGINGSVAGLTASTITNSKVTQMGSGKIAYSQATLANFRAVRAVPDSTAIRNGAYYLHPSMEQLLASFNTAGDRPYNPNAQLNNPGGAQPFVSGPTLDGFPIRWVDVMPAYSTSSNVSTVFALFGDASFQYLGIRGGVRFDTSLEAGFTTDEILIRALERFTIGLMALGSVAGIETAAS